MLPYILGLLVFVGIALAYYFFFEKPRREIRERMRRLHFDVNKVIDEMKPATFKYYNDKLKNLLYLWLFPTAGTILVPRYTLPYPYSAIATTVGAFFMALVVVIASIKMNEQERAEAMNKPFGNAFVNYGELGDQDQLFRSMKMESEIKLDEKQKEIIADQVVETIKEMPLYKQFLKEGKKVDLKEMRSRILDRLRDSHVYRCTVDKYHILFITKHEWHRLTTPETTRVIHRTIEMDVNLLPFWGIYGGTTQHIFKGKNNKGEIEFVDRAMGIYLDLYDLESRNQDLLGGKFVAPDAMTLLLGEFLHLYEQRSYTAREMTKALRKMEQAQLEAEKNAFEAKAEANKIVNSTEHLLKVLSELLKPRVKTKEDYAMWVLLFAFGMLVMLMMVRAGWIPT